MEELAGRESVESGDFEPAIEVKDLVVRYGNKRAVDGLSLTVPKGSIYGFLGPNGSGKTTTIKTLMGFRGPDGGRAQVLGHDVLEEGRQARAKVGYVGETSSLYGSMSAYQHGKLCRSLGEEWDQRLFEHYLEFFRLPREVKARKLSKGQKVQLELCLALGGKSGASDPGRACVRPRPGGAPEVAKGDRGRGLGREDRILLHPHPLRR